MVVKTKSRYQNPDNIGGKETGVGAAKIHRLRWDAAAQLEVLVVK
jgi:hypothetical protein